MLPTCSSANDARPMTSLLQIRKAHGRLLPFSYSDYVSGQHYFFRRRADTFLLFFFNSTLLGKKVIFITGTDEHGEKIATTAAA